MAKIDRGPKSRKPRAKSRVANVAGEIARDRLLTTAISMFAHQGYAAVSTREITKKAGLNQAAIYYHFGTKRKIYIEAILHCFHQVTESRLKMLSESEAAGDMTLESVLRAFIAPHVRYVTRRDGHDYLRIFATFSSTPDDLIFELYRDHLGPLRVRFAQAIKKVVPGISDDELLRALGFVANQIVSALFDAGYQAVSGHRSYNVNVEPFIENLVAYNAAGIRALQHRQESRAPQRSKARATGKPGGQMSATAKKKHLTR